MPPCTAAIWMVTLRDFKVKSRKINSTRHLYNWSGHALLGIAQISFGHEWSHFTRRNTKEKFFFWFPCAGRMTFSFTNASKKWKKPWWKRINKKEIRWRVKDPGKPPIFHPPCSIALISPSTLLDFLASKHENTSVAVHFYCKQW